MTSQPGGRRTGAFRTDPVLARRVAVKRFLARLVLFAERLLPLFLPLLGIAAIFVSLAWLGVYRQLPDLLRLGLVFVLIALLSDSVWGLAAGSARAWRIAFSAQLIRCIFRRACGLSLRSGCQRADRRRHAAFTSASLEPGARPSSW